MVIIFHSLFLLFMNYMPVSEKYFFPLQAKA